MKSNGLAGILAVALVTLATIFAYNKFSGRSIAALGAGATK